MQKGVLRTYVKEMKVSPVDVRRKSIPGRETARAKAQRLLESAGHVEGTAKQPMGREGRGWGERVGDAVSR